jgi:hypothetical protein
MITFSDDTPLWIRDWVKWACAVLIPDWYITVKMVDDLGEEDDDEDYEFSSEHLNAKGTIEVSTEYLSASVEFLKSLSDTPDGHVRVIHEICHAFLARMEQGAELLMKLYRKKPTRSALMAWKNYNHLEEETVVRLSRILLQWREGELNGSIKTA